MYEQEKWELREASAARLGLSAETFDLVMLPAFSRRTVRTTLARKQLLRDHLHAQFAAVSKLPPEAPADSDSDADSSRSPQTFSLERVCATCRGHCCRNGGNHGYISASTLQRTLAADGAPDASALMEIYAGHVPARSYAGSCIFHGTSGCALPRELRSEVCTRFLCGGIKNLQDRTVKAPERAVVAVFDRGAGPARVNVVHKSEVREFKPLRWRQTT